MGGVCLAATTRMHPCSSLLTPCLSPSSGRRRRQDHLDHPLHPSGKLWGDHLLAAEGQPDGRDCSRIAPVPEAAPPSKIIVFKADQSRLKGVQKSTPQKVFLSTRPCCCLHEQDDFQPGSPQYEFFLAELKATDRKKTPWWVLHPCHNGEEVVRKEMGERGGDWPGYIPLAQLECRHEVLLAGKQATGPPSSIPCDVPCCTPGALRQASRHPARPDGHVALEAFQGGRVHAHDL